MPEIFWIREICNADWRNRTSARVREVFAKLTLEQAIKDYETKMTVGQDGH